MLGVQQRRGSGDRLGPHGEGAEVEVQGALTMPWAGRLAWIREDNAFRSGVSLLPPSEGAALWAQFDAEMDRLYAVVNEGKELDPRD